MPRPKGFILTGPSGAGKSSIAKAFKAKSWRVLDGDAVAKSLYRPGSSLLTSVSKAFGKSVLREDGSLDAVRLGEIVFPSLAQRKRLNRLVYPAFLRAVRRAVATHPGPWVLDLAVYFDAGAPALGLPVVLVEAPLAERKRRLTAMGVAPGRASARASALRFGPAQRAQSDLRLDGRDPIKVNVKKILGFLEA
jgi:dephospho-CoA kinase